MTIDHGRLAYRTIDAFGWDITWKDAKPVPDDAWPIDIINRHIAEAVAAERERCAAICRQVANDHYSAWAEVCETRIRSGHAP